MLNTTVSLKQLNREEVLRLIPLVIYLLLLMFLGLIGNILVFYVYKLKFRTSNCRTFIIFLSIVDIFTCALVIPFEILTIFRQYNFRHAWVCKLSVFLNTWPTLSSGLLFLSIAVDRYRKVCKPFSWQISHAWALRLCAINTVIGLVFSVPSHMLYGIYTRTLPVYNITMTECAVTLNMRNSVFPLINNIMFLVLFVGALVSMSVMYCLIGIKVKAHSKRTRVFRSPRRRPESSSLDDTTNASEMTIQSGKVCKTNRKSNYRENESDALFCSETTETTNPMIELAEREPDIAEMHDIDGPSKHEHRDRNHSNSSNRKSILSRMLSVGRYSMNLVSHTLSSSSNIESHLVHRKSRKRQSASRQMKTQKSAYVMFLISLAFVLSYLPLLCLLLLRSTISDFVENLTDHDRAVYKFFLRSYYLNCAVNPIIYGFWDARFRKTCKKLLHKPKC